MTHTERYLSEVVEIARRLDREAIERAVEAIARTRVAGGRLFVLGVGGSAATASHAVNDFRKIAGLEAYAPTDNVSELTARTNDEGWGTVFEAWLRSSRLRAPDLVLVLSVGGGDIERNISANLAGAVRLARERGATVVGIVGRDGGYTARMAHHCVLVPVVDASRVTPHTEAFHGVVLHLMASHPALQVERTKWESAPAEEEPAVYAGSPA